VKGDSSALLTTTMGRVDPVRVASRSNTGTGAEYRKKFPPVTIQFHLTNAALLGPVNPVRVRTSDKWSVAFILHDDYRETPTPPKTSSDFMFMTFHLRPVPLFSLTLVSDDHSLLS